MFVANKFELIVKKSTGALNFVREEMVELPLVDGFGSGRDFYCRRYDMLGEYNFNINVLKAGLWQLKGVLKYTKCHLITVLSCLKQKGLGIFKKLFQ